MSVYAGLFLTAFSMLSLEITLVRLLSVTTWYHLAFFAISTAMLGMTAGAVRVYLRPAAFEAATLARALAGASLRYALATPVTLLLICLLPLDLYEGAMGPGSMITATVVCCLPFYFGGTVISAVVTKARAPIGRLYASDLAGASLGCLFVLAGLEVLDAPSLILGCAALGALAGVCFAWPLPARGPRWAGALVCAALASCAAFNSRSLRAVRPVLVKGRVEPAYRYHFEKWNSFSRVAVFPKCVAAPQYWGPSPIAPGNPIEQYIMSIDGEAGTAVRRFASRGDIEHLGFDVTNIGYHLRRRGPACVIGVGGGRDVQAAILFGHDHVTGIELNPVFVRLLEGEFRDFAGLADRPDVTLIADEARSRLSRSEQTYGMIQMSLIDTWAATAAGAFSLSENSLYTVEAWELFMRRLRDDGVFSVSRWYSPEDIGETGRMLSLAVAALLKIGVGDPARHIALIGAGHISTLLVCRSAFSAADVRNLKTVCRRLGFSVVHAPGDPPSDSLLRAIVLARSDQDLAAAAAGAELNLTPTTDENPYFFNMLRLRNIGRARSEKGGVLKGNLTATLTLMELLGALAAVALFAIVVPLALRPAAAGSARTPVRFAGALYFVLIGAGFMLTEIALIQRLTVLLSHPVYALGILLFTLIASTGAGSLMSDRLPLTRPPWLYVYPVLAACCILGLRFLLSALLPALASATIPARVLASVAVIFPVGLLMGLFFPTGMRLVNERCAADTPWYWALNGVFGVLCSALAVLISIYAGISINFYLAAACYAAVILAQIGLRASEVRSAG